MRRLVLPVLLALAAALVVVMILLDHSPGPTSDPGVASLERFFNSYVEALNARDATAIGDLLDESPESKAVRDRLDRFGGRGIRDVRVSASSEFPQVYRVSLSGRYVDGAPLLVDEVVEWTGTRWHLAPLVPVSSYGGSRRL
jgi:hypothetical protein